MNKQGPKNKLWALKQIDEEIEEARLLKSAEYNEGYEDGCQYSQRVIDMMDEPKKPVVPKFVAEWFEENKDDLEFPIWELCVDSYGSKDEHGMLNWIQQSENNPIETLIRMKDGYEVEKEPLYYVKLPVVYFNHWNLEAYLMKDDRGNITIADNNDFDDMKFTESEIKEIDERYWPFAVPVEEGLEQEEVG
ncbi:DUF1642 domain-containing protein [Enterococcus faecium]|uniref:DUF1642 domain-containing protein n=1 Tax=Enterococcus TaxID=1350 RepID=UPI0018A9D6F6|nr:MULTISPECIES: DUF1642 domain-containing protein [Enterococcus]MCB8608201.1 DUF1642 domain-containing protein [Enterococcus lactis]MDB7359735.1 DUF1642 domain-containing protein [Enterococcus faecium]MDB7377826.1 DUF1642 domain-containing protein [Enterococcus faecium]MDB7380380.1 DUF1642 domain-containing protein [Enterococcus faecium]MDB7385512.1 DUF1642 domain-containing protein [Enterococcus faecium]